MTTSMLAMLAGCLAGWLAGWLPGCLAGRLAGCPSSERRLSQSCCTCGRRGRAPPGRPCCCEGDRATTHLRGYAFPTQARIATQTKGQRKRTGKGQAGKWTRTQRRPEADPGPRPHGETPQHISSGPGPAPAPAWLFCKSCSSPRTLARSNASRRWLIPWLPKRL